MAKREKIPFKWVVFSSSDGYDWKVEAFTNNIVMAKRVDDLSKSIYSHVYVFDLGKEYTAELFAAVNPKED